MKKWNFILFSVMAFLLVLSSGAGAISIVVSVSSDVSLISDMSDQNFGTVHHPYNWVGNLPNGRRAQTMFGFDIPSLAESGEELVINSVSFNAWQNAVSFPGPVRISEGNTDDWDPLVVTWDNSRDNYGAELDSVYLERDSVFNLISWDISGAGANTFNDGFFTAYLYSELSDGNSWHDFKNLDVCCLNTAYLNINYDVHEQTAPVPEPATMFLLGIGLLGLGFIERKRQKVKS